jgi:DNA-binding transcriptional LysR family regulator
VNFKLIAYFIDIAKYRSFTEASLRNHISLPAMSQAIKRLEEELGFALFLHGKNKFQLSPEAEIFLPQANDILKAWSQIRKTNSEKTTSSKKRETISLGAPSSLLSSIFIQDLSRICTTQNYHLRLFTGSSRVLRNLLEDRTCDFAICIDDPFLQSFASVSLFRGQFGVYQSNAYHKKEAFIVGDFGAEVRNLMSYYQKKFNRPLPIVAEVASWDLIAQLIELKTGQGLLPDFHRVAQNKDITEVFKFYPRTTYEIKLYAHSSSANKLFNFLAENFRNRQKR